MGTERIGLQSATSLLVKGALMLAIAMLMALSSFGQDVGAIDWRHPFKFSGGLNGSVGYYHAFGIPNRRDPFMYNLSANVNLKVLNTIDVPFSMSFSQQQTSLTQPSYNQFGLSPTYKWAKLHLGYRNMNFSQYTLAGHTFLGAGVELTPGKFSFGAMYGRFRKAIAEDSALIAKGLDPSFKRMGYGLKFGYKNNEDEINLVLFHAQDDANSIPLNVEKPNVTPMENLVLGVVGKKKIGKHLQLEADFGTSAITRDVRGEKVNEGGNLFSIFGPLFTTRSSTSYKKALSGAVAWNAEKYQLRGRYKRIDADYTTLGAYFFNNDVEEAALGISFGLLQGKVSIASEVGIQRNNLAGDKATRNSRVIGSGNISYTPTEDWAFSFSLSNNSSYLKVQQEILSDSLNFYQVARDVNFNVSHNLGTQDRSQAVFGSVAYQRGFSREEYAVNLASETDFISVNLGHRFQIKAKELQLNSGLSYSHNISDSIPTTSIGPTFSINRQVLDKKLKLAYNMSWVLVSYDGALQNAVWNNRFTSAYKLAKKHSLNGTIQFTNNAGLNPTAKKFSELKLLMGYGFNF